MSTLRTFSTLFFLCFLIIPSPSSSFKLSTDFYDEFEFCPEALFTIQEIVEAAIADDPRMGASLLRLHFHDCFVNGCDASILLDDTPTMTGEKTAGPNNNSIRGYEVIDDIKEALSVVCTGNVVSCADILAVAARDSIVALGGSPYEVLLGRRDSISANIKDANKQIPSPFLNLSGLIANFKSHGLSARDLVLLSGAHSIGFARCLVFRARIYNETSSIDPAFADDLRQVCPVHGNNDGLSGLDESSLSFDETYYRNLMEKRGLLHTDQELYRGDGGEVDELVEFYSGDVEAFWEDFGGAMVRMGSIGVLTGESGEVREDCRVVN